MWAMTGDQPGFEEAMRALYASDEVRFDASGVSGEMEPAGGPLVDSLGVGDDTITPQGLRTIGDRGSPQPERRRGSQNIGSGVDPCGA